MCPKCRKYQYLRVADKNFGKRKNSKTAEKRTAWYPKHRCFKVFSKSMQSFGFFCILAESGSKAGCANPLGSSSPVDSVIFSYN